MNNMDPDSIETTAFAASGSIVHEDNPAKHRALTIDETPRSSLGDEESFAVVARTHINIENDSMEPIDETAYETSAELDPGTSPANGLERHLRKAMKESTGRETIGTRFFHIETPVSGFEGMGTSYTPEQKSDARKDLIFSLSNMPEHSIGPLDSTGYMSVYEMLTESSESTQVAVSEMMPESTDISISTRPSDPVMIPESFSNEAGEEESSLYYACTDACTEYSSPNQTNLSSIHEAYISEFVRHLFGRLRSQGLSMQALQRVSGVMADNMKGFATRLGLNAHDQIQRDVVYFTHRHRRQVVPYQVSRVIN